MRSEDLYIMQAHGSGAIKIGRTNDVGRRLSELQTSNPAEIRILIVLEGQGNRERSLHRRLVDHRLRGEWFSYEGLAELPDDIYELMDIEMMDSWWVPAET